MRNFILFSLVTLLLITTAAAEKKITVDMPLDMVGDFEAYANWSINGDDISCKQDQGGSMERTYDIQKGTTVSFYCNTPDSLPPAFSGEIELVPVDDADMADACNMPLPFQMGYGDAVNLTNLWERQNEYNSILKVREVLSNHVEGEVNGDLIAMGVEDDGKIKGEFEFEVKDSIRDNVKWQILSATGGGESWWQWLFGDGSGEGTYDLGEVVMEGDLPSSGNTKEFDLTPQSGSHIDIQGWSSVFILHPPNSLYDVEDAYVLRLGIDGNGDGEISENEVVGKWGDPRTGEPENMYAITGFPQSDINTCEQKNEDKVNSYFGNVLFELPLFNLARFMDFEPKDESEFSFENYTVGTKSIDYNYQLLQYPAGADFDQGNNIDKIVFNNNSKPASYVYESNSLNKIIYNVMQDNLVEVSNHFQNSDDDYTFTRTFDNILFSKTHSSNLYFAYGSFSGETEYNIEVTVTQNGGNVELDKVRVTGALEDLYDWTPNEVPFPLQVSWDSAKGKKGRVFYTVIELDHTFTKDDIGMTPYSQLGSIAMSDFNAGGDTSGC